MMVITLVAALSMEATYDRVIDDPALRAKPWDVRVQPGASASAQALQLVRGAAAASSARRRSPGFQVTTAAAAHEVQARALGDGFERFAYAVPDGRMFARPGEAIAGRGFFERFGARDRRHGHAHAPPAGRSRSRSSGATSSPTTTARS